MLPPPGFDFTSFLILAFFGGLHYFFLQLGCFGLDITSSCIASHKVSYKLALVLPFNFFLYCRICGTKEAIVCIAFCLIKYLYIVLNEYPISNKVTFYITEL